MKMRSLLTLLIVLTSFYKLIAQKSPSEELNYLKDKYPKESGIVTKLDRKLIIKLVDDSLQITSKQYREIMILGNETQWSNGRVYSSSFNKVADIQAYTLLPGKKKYKKANVSEFKKSFDTNTFVFYDDTEVISYNYPQLQIGAKIVTEQTTKINDPHLLGQFFFSSYIPSEVARFEILVDKSVSIKHGLFNKELANIDFKENVLPDGRIQYIYESKDLDKIDLKNNSVSYNYVCPSAFVTVASYKDLSGEQHKVLSSVDDLYDWYKSFIKDLEIDESIRQTAASLVNANDDQREKIRKIFYWVQKNVKYIAFEQGMRGFIPHPADYVMDKRYGDCKDMTSILVGLLRSQGISANFTWIGTRDLPYKYSELPSPSVDNHMIASVELAGETIFLDATGSYSPLGYPTSMIQGKESLVSLDDDYKIVEVPVIPKEKNLMIDTAYASIQGEDLIGKGTLQLEGLVKVANTYRLVAKNNKSQENYLRRLLSRGSNKFFLEDYELQNVDDLDQPIFVDYQFKVGNYYREIGDEIYINLCLDKSLINSQIKDHNAPLKNDYKYTNRNVTVFDLPQDYTISYLPENSSLESKNFGFDISYKQNGNQIIVNKEFYVDYLQLDVNEFEEWNSSIKKYAQAVRNTVILKKEKLVKMKRIITIVIINLFIQSPLFSQESWEEDRKPLRLMKQNKDHALLYLFRGINI